MDKNSVIGLILIAILIGSYTYFNQPSPEELQASRKKQDSIAALQVVPAADTARPVAPVVDTATASALPAADDTSAASLLRQQWGDFSGAATGTERFAVIENDVLRVTLSTLGGQIRKAELKKYKSDTGQPVVLLSDDSSSLSLSFPAQNRTIQTHLLYFEPGEVQRHADGSQSVTMKLNAGTGRAVEYTWTLEKQSYVLDYDIRMVGMEQLIPSNLNILQVDWQERIHSLEKSVANERNASTIYYCFSDEEVDYLTYASDEELSLKTKVKWLAFKQQFFTSVLIAGDYFESPVVETVTGTTPRHVSDMKASFTLPYNHKPGEHYALRLYIGPNHYQTLKKVDNLHLEQQINLGWGIFGAVNRFLVIPTFNFLNSFNMNFGIIILILTVLIRIVLLPLTYGSFKSQAKMKVLQPEIAEITTKIPDDPMKRQQETMSLYRKAGVNPLGGCIPGLLQLPILIAMFSFFPASIELRQESFLWADDLSTYDSVLDLPFHIPGYGAHVSLFTLLMTVSTLLYTKMNLQMTSAANPQMKWMMYLMPIIFLGVFNSYSAGLSYYYFLSNVIGFGQQYLFKAFIDEDAIHRKIQENKKRPQQKKSGFQQRLEQMAKERGYKAKK